MRKVVILIVALSQVSNATTITIDNMSQSAFASATSVTWTHILGSSTACPNSLLVASCGNDASTFSSVRYAGINMTQKVHELSTETQDIWVLSNSTTTGSNSIVATNGAAVNVICSAISLCNVNSTTPTGATAVGQVTSTNPSTAITLQSSASWTVDGLFNNGTTPNVLSNPIPAINNFGNLTNAGGPSTQSAYAQGPFPSGLSQNAAWTQPQSLAWTKAVLEVKVATGTPTITTQPPTAIMGKSATGNGTLLGGAGFQVTDDGICWATHVNPTTADSCVSVVASGAYTGSITGLSPGIGYHVRAYATNSQGTDYGVDIPFGTLALNPVTSYGTGGIWTVQGTGGIATIQ